MSHSITSSFANKVAFISGAANGIGRATALAFAREGASVAVVDIKEDDLADVVKEIEEAGGTALAIVADVSRSEDIRSALDKTVEAFGGLDIAFNNAGVEQPMIPLTEIGEDDFDRLVAIDLRGVFLAMKYQIPLLKRCGGGSIVNTSSGAGVVGIKGQAGYVAVKHAVVGISKSVALEVIGDNVRVNVICPGVIATPMILDRMANGTEEGKKQMEGHEPIGRLGKPEEIASAVLYMCSDAAAFMVGHAMVVDGGQTAGLPE
jgi:NAD(P)-dependent dehydrogenase (short-subunit alcohol dehydrogenase family)